MTPTAIEKYSDISGYPFVPGDKILTRDDVNPDIYYKIRIVDIENNPKNLSRIITYVLIDTNSDVAQTGLTSTMELSNNTCVMGVIEPLNGKLDQAIVTGSDRDHILFGVLQFLKSRLDKNYTAPVASAVAYLKTNYLLPESTTPEEGKQILLKICQAYPSTVRIRNRYIKLVNLKPSEVPKTVTGSANIRTVDFNILIDGIRKVLESGIFGNIEFK